METSEVARQNKARPQKLREAQDVSRKQESTSTKRKTSATKNSLTPCCTVS